MKKIYSLLSILLFIANYSSAQFQFNQYFDGADTSKNNSIFIKLEPGTPNIWQVGKPKKTIFKAAATVPNVIVTDTINKYPLNNTSRFSFKIFPFSKFGVLAVHWKQKLDMDKHHSGGIIEFSADKGSTWLNAFNNPHTYNFYGFLPANRDTLLTGEYALSGTDTTWRDLWLCFDLSWMSVNDTIYVRYTFKSDGVSAIKEGWMIDNMMVNINLFHPIQEANKKDYLEIFPNPSTGIVNIEIQKIQDFHIIEEMTLTDGLGRVVKEWKNIPTKFWFDTSKYARGIYYLKVKTNLRTQTIPIIVDKN